MPTNTRGTTARQLYTEQVHYLMEPISFDGPTTVSLGYLPAGAVVTASGTSVATAFNAGTTNNLDIGITGSLNTYGDNIALGSAGVKNGTITATAHAVIAADTEVFATVQLAGTAASAGAAEVWLQYHI